MLGQEFYINTTYVSNIGEVSRSLDSFSSYLNNVELGMELELKLRIREKYNVYIISALGFWESLSF